MSIADERYRMECVYSPSSQCMKLPRRVSFVSQGALQDKHLKMNGPDNEQPLICSTFSPFPWSTKMGRATDLKDTKLLRLKVFGRYAIHGVVRVSH